MIVCEARRVLNRNGFLFIDVINGFSLKNGTYDISSFKDGNIEISLKMKPKRMDDRYLLKYSYSISDHQKTTVKNNITIYPITSVDLREMLLSENFGVEDTFGDYDLSPLEASSEKLIVKARAI
jgi:hypothetical protein